MFTGVKALREVRTDLKLIQDRVMVLEQEKEVLVLNLERIKKGAEKVTESRGRGERGGVGDGEGQKAKKLCVEGGCAGLFQTACIS